VLTSGLLARVPRIAPLTIVSGVTAPIFAVVVIVVVTLANRNDRVIVAIVEILRGGRLVIVRIATHAKLSAFVGSPTPVYRGNAG